MIASMMFSISTLIGAVVLMSVALPGSSGYSYVCNDDDSIVVSNLPSTSVSFFAYQGSTVCSTSGDYNAVTVTGCTKDVPIVLAHGSYTDMPNNQLLGGLEIQTLDILCEEISTAGVAHSINNTMAPSVSHYDEVTLMPSYDVSSSLNVSSAFVGDPILWTISYPSSYYIEIASCKAYPGTSSGSTYVDLINTWCTATTELLTDFSSTTGSGVATSVIEAFKFYNNNAVYLYCELLVCPTSSGCTTSCASTGKRSLKANPVGVDEPKHAGVGTYLRIMDPYSSANINVPGFLLFIVAVISTLSY